MPGDLQNGLHKKFEKYTVGILCQIKVSLKTEDYLKEVFNHFCLNLLNK